MSQDRRYKGKEEKTEEMQPKGYKKLHNKHKQMLVEDIYGTSFH